MSSEFLAWQSQDLYALLGITRMASEEDIRKAFRTRAKDCHPDRFPLGSAERLEADSRFKELTLARDTLLDVGQRADYDRQQDLVQQAYFDAVVYQVPVQAKSPPKNSFGDTLKKVYQEYQAQEEAGQSYFDSANAESEEDPAEHGKGVPEASRKNAASFYYSQGMRLAARGQFRRALYALNNARMLDPELDISDSLISRIRAKAWYSKS
ncbi:MAG: DnaJ domain-containing protein [Candidatus Sericytochromatia bacterium]